MVRLRFALPALALTLALATSIACNKSGPTGSTCPTNSTLTYESFGKSFMTTYCTECHSRSGHGEQPMLDDIASIRAASAEIDRTSAAGPDATNTDMPEGMDVSDSEREKLGEWLACGAP